MPLASLDSLDAREPRRPLLLWQATPSAGRLVWWAHMYSARLFLYERTKKCFTSKKKYRELLRH